MYNRHGMRYTSEYNAYYNARRRCANPKAEDWKNYGGRGIEFRFKSFLEFFAELGSKPSPKHTIDRVNNNGHYEPGNVRWTTRSNQIRNRRKFVRTVMDLQKAAELRSKGFMYREIAAQLGVSMSLVWKRLNAEEVCCQ